MSARTHLFPGNYTLVQLLGQGGFSDVYLGEHIHPTTFAAMQYSLSQKLIHLLPVRRTIHFTPKSLRRKLQWKLH
jgi:hypothetical protein